MPKIILFQSTESLSSMYLAKLKQAIENYHFFEEIDSTSSFLKRTYKKSPQVSFCSADLQTSGYGRLGNKWESQAKDITFSLLLKFNQPVSNLFGLSQLVTLEICKTLAVTRPGYEYKVKWPNDVYIEKAKLAGVLIEVLQQTATESWLVIGIGINQVSNSSFDSYQSVAANFDEPDEVVARISLGLIELAKTFTDKTWSENQQTWQDFDLFQNGDEIRLESSQGQIFGRYAGLDSQANLLLKEFKTEEIKAYSSGAVSLRSPRQSNL